LKNILITGGAGYIGSHTAFYLINKGLKVTIIDVLDNGSFEVIKNLKKLIKINCPKNISNLDFQQGDIRSYKCVNNLFHRKKQVGEDIQSVIHFAGLKSVNESFHLPLEYWDVNLNGTINLIKNMDLFNCRKFVFSSSASIYGNSLKKLIKEDSEIKPTNPYSFTKASCERFLEDLTNDSKKLWSIASLRYFNPIGAHPSGLIGEVSKRNLNNIFPIINDIGIGNKKILEIYGKDWPTPDGTCLRDYIHVEDLSEGHFLALEYLFSHGQNGFISFNIGTGKGVSVLELVNQFQNINKVKIPYVFSARRKGDVPILIADNTKAKKILNWSPKRDLKTMCQDGWNWKLLNK